MSGQRLEARWRQLEMAASTDLGHDKSECDRLCYGEDR